MSNPPDPSPLPLVHPSYLPPAPPFPPDQPPYPAALKTVGILNIIAAGLSFCWALLMIVETVFALTGILDSGIVPPPQPPRSFFVVLCLGFFLLAFLFGLVQLISGMTLLKRSPNSHDWAVSAAAADFLAMMFWCCLPYYLFVATYTIVVISRGRVKDRLWTSAPRRPLAVTIAAVVAILWAALIALGLLTLLAQITGFWHLDPQIASLYEDPFWHLWAVFNSVLGAALLFAWLHTGLGLLRLKRWALFALILLACFTILHQLVGLVVMPAIFLRVSMSPVTAATMILSVIFGAVLAVAVSVTLIILITRPNVRQAFANPPS